MFQKIVELISNNLIIVFSMLLNLIFITLIFYYKNKDNELSHKKNMNQLEYHEQNLEERENFKLMRDLLNLGFTNFSVSHISKGIVDRLTKYYSVTYVTLFIKEDDDWLKILASNIPKHELRKVEKYYNKLKENCNEGTKVQITDRLGTDFLSLRGLGYSNFSLITHRGNTIGALVLENNEPLSIEKDDFQKELYDKIFNATAIILNHMLEVGNLIKNVSTDQLTGIYNRRYIDINLEEELKKHKMLEQKFHVVMLDIWHFKNFNDTYGHQFGDKVVQEGAKYIKDSIGSHSWVARYGGEEFMIVIANSEVSRVYKKVDSIRKGIENLELEYEGEIASVTSSFGISGFPKNALTVYDLVEKADEALYEAKETGRNKVVVFGYETQNVKRTSEEILFS